MVQSDLSDFAAVSYGSVDQTVSSPASYRKRRAAILAVACVLVISAAVVVAINSNNNDGDDEAQPTELSYLTPEQAKKDAKRRAETMEREKMDQERAKSSKIQAASALNQIFKAISKASQGKHPFSFAKLEKEITDVEAAGSSTGSSLLTQIEHEEVLAKKARTAAVAAQLDYGTKAGQQARTNQAMQNALERENEATSDYHLSELNVDSAKKKLAAKIAKQVTLDDQYHESQQEVAAKEERLKDALADRSKAQKLAVEKLDDLKKATRTTSDVEKRATETYKESLKTLYDAVASAKAELAAEKATEKSQKESLLEAEKKKELDVGSLKESVATHAARVKSAMAKLTAAQTALKNGKQDLKTKELEKRTRATATESEAAAQAKLAKDAAVQSNDDVTSARMALSEAKAELASAETDKLEAARAVARAKAVLSRKIKLEHETKQKVSDDQAVYVAKEIQAKDTQNEAASSEDAANKLDQEADDLEKQIKLLKQKRAEELLAKKKALKKAKTAAGKVVGKSVAKK